MDIIRSVQQVASPFLDQLMLSITELGSERAYVALLVIAYLAFDPARGRRLTVYFLAGFYLNQLLKGVFDTARPFELDPSLLRLEEARGTAIGAGFPSGHAQSSATFWGLAALYVRRRSFTVVAVTLVVLVSFSRLYLGVHLPADVFGGVLIGLAVVSFGAALDRLWRPPPAVLGVLLGIGAPLALHLSVTTPESNLILGGLAAFLTGPTIYPYRPDRSRWRRALVAAIGLLLVFGYLLGTSLVLSDEVKDHPLWGFLRYLILGYVGTVVAPLLGRVLRLGRWSS